MSYEEMMKKVKEEFDQFYDETDMYTLQILWIIERIDGDYPIHDAMNIAYEIQDQYRQVKQGIIPHW